jgi:hypothetical protein
MRLDQALVRASKYIDDKFGKKKIESAQMGYGSLEGRLAGRAAADRMDIGKRGITQTQKVLR